MRNILLDLDIFRHRLLVFPETSFGFSLRFPALQSFMTLDSLGIMGRVLLFLLGFSL